MLAGASIVRAGGTYCAEYFRSSCGGPDSAAQRALIYCNWCFLDVSCVNRANPEASPQISRSTDGVVTLTGGVNCPVRLLYRGGPCQLCAAAACVQLARLRSPGHRQRLQRRQGTRSVGRRCRASRTPRARLGFGVPGPRETAPGSGCSSGRSDKVDGLQGFRRLKGTTNEARWSLHFCCRLPLDSGARCCPNEPDQAISRIEAQMRAPADAPALLEAFLRVEVLQRSDVARPQ